MELSIKKIEAIKLTLKTFASKASSWMKMCSSAFKWVWEHWKVDTQEEETYSLPVVSGYWFSVGFLLFLVQEETRWGAMGSNAALNQGHRSLLKSYGYPRLVGSRWQIICRNGRRGSVLLSHLEGNTAPVDSTVHVSLCSASSMAGH